MLKRDILRRSAASVAALDRAAVQQSGARPFAASPEIVDGAAARGPLHAFQPRETVTTDAGNKVVRPAGWKGLNAARRVTALSLMDDQAARRFNGDPATREPLFTAAHQVTADDYAELSERVSAFGMKCARLDGAGGGGRDDTMERQIADRAHLDRMCAAIGADVALFPRNRSSHPDRNRRPITVRKLVDVVCLGNQTISVVLAQHGWSRKQVYTAALYQQLCAALDRIRAV